MTPGRLDARVVNRHLVALRKVLAFLHRHAGVSPESPRAGGSRRWAVDRSLQLCARNANVTHRTYRSFRH